MPDLLLPKPARLPAISTSVIGGSILLLIFVQTKTAGTILTLLFFTPHIQLPEILRPPPPTSVTLIQTSTIPRLHLARASKQVSLPLLYPPHSPPKSILNVTIGIL